MSQTGQHKIAVVTGANGFVGSHLVDLLIEKGYTVRAIIRSTSKTKWLDDKAVELHRCGLLDIEALSKAFTGANYIFHIAGSVRVKDFDAYYRGNVMLTQKVLEAALPHASSIEKIVVTSSLAAGGPATATRMIKEEDEPKPVSWYGKSKLAQEQLCKSYFNKLPINIARPPVVYGPRDTEVYLFFQSVKRGLVPIAGYNNQHISIVHVSDLVKGLLTLATGNTKGQVYYLCNKEQYDWHILGDTAKEVMAKKALKVRIPIALIKVIAAFGDLGTRLTGNVPTLNGQKVLEIIQEAWTCSPDKAKTELDFETEIDLRSGFEQTIEWYKKEGWL